MNTSLPDILTRDGWRSWFASLPPAPPPVTSIPEAQQPPAQSGVTDYWMRHNVTLNHQFTAAEESLAYLRWRNDQYFGYIELMPVDGQDGQVVLDFGCGPGHDLVGFATMSRLARLFGADVSPTSLAEARARLALHGAPCEFLTLKMGDELPLATASVDYVHTSGVLHHLPDPLATLRELRRVLRPGGMARVMVYNYDSVWMHLYVAYIKRLVEGLYQDVTLGEAFGRTTDGEECPISRAYRPSEFTALAAEAGFTGEFTGAAVSMFEAKVLPQRFDAIQDRRLPEESRRFLLDLTVDEHGLPRHGNYRAGIDGCYVLKPRP
jgi:ubiquinone/menaquinone biosynthesis C-methylase UbiE